MSDQKQNMSERQLMRLLTGVVLVVAAVLAAYSIAASWADFSFSLSPRDWEAFAGFFNGMATPVISLFALYVLAKTLRVNQQELSETRKQLEAAAIAQKDLVELEKNKQRRIDSELRYEITLREFDHGDTLPKTRVLHKSSIPEHIRNPQALYVQCYNAEQAFQVKKNGSIPVIRLADKWGDEYTTEFKMSIEKFNIQQLYRIFMDAYSAGSYRFDWTKEIVEKISAAIAVCVDTEVIVLNSSGEVVSIVDKEHPYYNWPKKLDLQNRLLMDALLNESQKLDKQTELISQKIKEQRQENAKKAHDHIHGVG